MATHTYHRKWNSGPTTPVQPDWTGEQSCFKITKHLAGGSSTRHPPQAWHDAIKNFLDWKQKSALPFSSPVTFRKPLNLPESLASSLKRPPISQCLQEKQRQSLLRVCFVNFQALCKLTMYHFPKAVGAQPTYSHSWPAEDLHRCLYIHIYTYVSLQWRWGLVLPVSNVEDMFNLRQNEFLVLYLKKEKYTKQIHKNLGLYWYYHHLHSNSMSFFINYLISLSARSRLQNQILLFISWLHYIWSWQVTFPPQ